MTKEQQDLIWACLPKEVRDNLHDDYIYSSEEWSNQLEDLFGKHNLTSDTEPEEMLMTPRKKVLEYYKDVQQAIGEENGDTRIEMEVRKWAMLYFFGDKCQPDKEPSVQVEPKYKFSLGQKVILHFHGGEKGTISERLPPQEGNVWNCYKVKELPYHLWRENELEPYTEPETKDANLATEASKLSTLEPKQTTETKDMVEKELNLCELLKGCEGEKIFIVNDGECIITEVANDEITFEHAVENRTIVFTKENISLQPTGFAYAYPSKESFLSHPLDAYSAWMEWKQTKEKEFNKVTSFIAPVSKWWELKVVAKFHSNEEATEAAKAVSGCLEIFHKDHTQQ